KDLESYLNGGGTNIIWFEGAQVDEDVIPADPKKGEIRINITFHPDGTIASSNLYYQGKSTWTHFAIGELSPRLARITNSYHQELINIEGTKTWDDENDSAGERPASITIRLLANGTEVASKTVNNAGGWKWLFENLPKYHNGAEIVYTITEDVVNGYSTTIDGYYVKNEYTPGKTNVQVTKAWDDANDQDGKRPESVTIKLFADGMDTGKTLVLNAANSWTGIFTNLDKQKEGKDIVYTVKEEAVGNGYATTVAGDMTKGFTVTNSRTPETVDVEGSKTWDDQGDQDGKRPGSIAIRLYKTVGGMTPVLVDGKDVTPDAGGNWTWSFKNLPKYQGGQLITYSVSEEAVPGYTPTINGYSIINSYVPETTDISVTKVWEDADNQDGLRADDVTVQLLADGKAVDGKTLTLNAGNSWMGMFSGLPVYKAVGQEIVYTVEETPVPHGYANMITGDAEAGFTITNSHVPGKTEIKVEKIWDDENNKDGSRPKSVTIKLLADGTDTGKTLVLTADNQWMGAFTDLDEYREGAKIIYTVHEQPVAGYEVLILEDEAKTGFTVTNSHKPKAPPIPPPPTTGESWGYYTLMAVSLITLGASLCLIRRRKCAQK
ncbi:MAG TPA: Cna B-type domain-containing protein, partial [Bacillota bacterium]|nr:Cna B-type domain-containing protein [Bacillota bacterium]